MFGLYSNQLYDSIFFQRCFTSSGLSSLASIPCCSAMANIFLKLVIVNNSSSSQYCFVTYIDTSYPSWKLHKGFHIVWIQCTIPSSQASSTGLSTCRRSWFQGEKFSGFPWALWRAKWSRRPALPGIRWHQMMFHFSLLVKAKCSSNKRRQSVELQKKISIIKNSKSGTKNVFMTSKQETSNFPC